MNPAHLIKMANQIGAFFNAMPQREEAIQGIAQHLQRTWEPRMLRALNHHITQHGTTDLNPIVKEALALIAVE